VSVFQSIASGAHSDSHIPSFDKSRFNGEGDRVPEADWARVPRTIPIDVVVFEGWCVGFQALSTSVVQDKWEAAQRETVPKTDMSVNTLADCSLEHLTIINEALRRYNESFMGPQHLDALVHLDTDDLVNVDAWRLGQEHAMWKERGAGMSDSEVFAFVKSYMPSSELYIEQLRKGMTTSEGKKPAQMRVVLDVKRRVVQMGEVGR